MCFTLRAPARLGAARRFIPLMENHIGAHRTISYDTLPPLHSPTYNMLEPMPCQYCKIQDLKSGG